MPGSQRNECASNLHNRRSLPYGLQSHLHDPHWRANALRKLPNVLVTLPDVFSRHLDGVRMPPKVGREAAEHVRMAAEHVQTTDEVVQVAAEHVRERDEHVR